MAWTTPRTWTTGELVTAAFQNTHIRDNELFLYDRRAVLAETSSTTLAVDTTAEADCLTLAAVTLDGVQRVLLSVFCRVGGVNGDLVELSIKEGATVLQRHQFYIPVTGGVGQSAMTLLWEFVPTAAAHTYKFTVKRSGGSGGNVYVRGEPSNPAYIMCQGIGV